MDYNKIKIKIETEFIGTHFNGINETEKILTDIIGKNVKWYDTKIDDGVDDDETENTYVMKSCFITEDDSVKVGIYYGDVNEEIGYVNIELNQPKRKEEFNCVTLSRADFENRGYDTSGISDDQMEHIASKIGKTLVENLYWECIDVWGDYLHLKK